MEDVSGHTQIKIETAHGTGDIALEYSNSGWPNDVNVDASSNNVGNVECINLNGQSQYWGYFKVSGTSAGTTIKVTYDEGGC
ncbi:PPC domain-containing protein [Pseudoalteromonas sp. MMG012]|uniref:PPC domain-containing protein n=1 Tax=Pseudoalteromonas sp. MMG012 TaxID=2822686 RepID=UPI0039172D38